MNRTSRRRPSNFNLLAALAAALLVFTLSGAQAAGVSSSNDYSFDYVSIGLGSSDAQSNDYSMISTMSAEGPAGAPASSADYSTTPVTGADVVTTPVTISEWSIE